MTTQKTESINCSDANSIAASGAHDRTFSTHSLYLRVIRYHLKNNADLGANNRY